MSPVGKPRWLIRVLAVWLLLAALPAWADPALWVARSATATVYLFGTVHALPPSADWHTAQVRRAFDAAGEVWLEVANPDDLLAQVGLVRQYGLDPSHPLSSKLSAPELARIDGALRQSGQAGGERMVEPLRPWLVGLMLSIAPIRAAGLDPASGVDLALNAEAKRAGKTVRGLETAEQQIRIFADLPPAGEVAFLRSALDDAAAGPTKLRAMIAAWLAGDEAALGQLAIDEDPGQAADLYRRMFIDRNIAWAGQIADRLKGGGVTFVAVGAGHLAGPDRVQAQLQKRGVTVARE